LAEYEASVFVSFRFDIREGDSIVEELHLIRTTLVAGALYRDLVDTGTVEPQPEKTSQNNYANDFKP
jgi:hypothetical protein